MFPRVSAAVLAMGLLIGCGKTPPSSSAPTPGTSEAEIASTAAELTQVLRKFSAERQRVPKSLDELVAEGYLTQLPPAPPGRKFVINDKVQVVLGKE